MPGKTPRPETELTRLRRLVEEWIEADEASDLSCFGDRRSQRNRDREQMALSRYFTARDALRAAVRRDTG